MSCGLWNGRADTALLSRKRSPLPAVRHRFGARYVRKHERRAKEKCGAAPNAHNCISRSDMDSDFLLGQYDSIITKFLKKVLTSRRLCDIIHLQKTTRV